jgi:pilus assembly protein CpaF
MTTSPENLDIFKDLPLADSTAPAHPAAGHLAAAARRDTGRRRIAAVPDQGTPARPVEAEPQEVPRPRAAESADLEPASDWTLIERLAVEISEIRQTRDETPENKDEIGRAIIAGVLASLDESRVRDGIPRLTQSQHQALQVVLFNQAYRMGAVQPLLDDPTIENIHINGFDRVIVRRSNGADEWHPAIASSDEALIEMIQTWCEERGEGAREFNAQNPRLSMMLPSGDRLQAAHPPIAPRPTLTIRCHRIKKITLDDLVTQYGMLSQAAADFLSACVKAKISIVVSGHPGAGKTTFVRALCASIGPWEPVITIETERELHLSEDQHYNLKSLEARPGQGERDPRTGENIGGVSLRELVADSLRFDAQRIIVGELRDDETEAVFGVFAGAAGSMTTIHAKTAKDAIAKLADLQQKRIGTSPAFAYRQIQDHIQIIVQLSRFSGPGQKRHVTEIAEVQPGGDGEAPIASLIFKSRTRGGDAVFQELPRDDMLWELEQHGYDVEQLRAG